MRYPLQSGPLLPSDTVANENALILGLNNQVGSFSPQTVSVGNTSDTTSDLLQQIIIPANLLQVAGDRFVLDGAGTLAANAHAKTVGLSFIQGTTTVSLSGISSASGNWTLSLNTIATGITGANQSYYGTFNLAGTVSALNGTMTLSDSLPITVNLTGQTATAGASDIVATFFGGNIIK